MKNLIRILAVLALLGTAVACGGPVDAADEIGDETAADLKYSATEPLSWVSMSQKAAERYADHTRLMNIEGQIGPTDGFTWTYTFQGDKNIWVTVQCDGRTAKVLSHETREYIMGVMSIDLAKVKVTTEKLGKIATKHGLHGRWLSASLSQPLTPNSHAHWFLNQGGQEIAVDAFTGAVQK